MLGPEKTRLISDGSTSHLNQTLSRGISSSLKPHFMIPRINIKAKMEIKAAVLFTVQLHDWINRRSRRFKTSLFSPPSPCTYMDVDNAVIETLC